jgi:hypothetical protein
VLVPEKVVLIKIGSHLLIVRESEARVADRQTPVGLGTPSDHGTAPRNRVSKFVFANCD